MDYLPDNTAFGMVEVDMSKLIAKNIISQKTYDANHKQILSRKLARHRKVKEEKQYNKQIE